jgi:hypothetical protein
MAKLSTENMVITRDKGMQIFDVLVGLGYAVALKHMHGKFYLEIPVRLRGDKVYGKEAEIATLAERAGLGTVQAGGVLRVIGR